VPPQQRSLSGSERATVSLPPRSSPSPAPARATWRPSARGDSVPGVLRQRSGSIVAHRHQRADAVQRTGPTGRPRTTLRRCRSASCPGLRAALPALQGARNAAFGVASPAPAPQPETRQLAPPSLPIGLGLESWIVFSIGQNFLRFSCPWHTETQHSMDTRSTAAAAARDPLPRYLVQGTVVHTACILQPPTTRPRPLPCQGGARRRCAACLLTGRPACCCRACRAAVSAASLAAPSPTSFARLRPRETK
jgi:hypothetical protein